MATIGGARKARAQFWSKLALLSNFTVAAGLGAILWEYFIPDISTLTKAVTAIGIAGLTAVLYLALQFFAVVSRRVGDTGAEVLDMFMSFTPLLVIVINIGIRVSEHGVAGAYDSLEQYQLWISVIFFVSALADLAISSKAAFKFMFLGNDMVIGN